MSEPLPQECFKCGAHFTKLEGHVCPLAHPAAPPPEPQGSTAFLLRQNAELREQRAALTENCERLERERDEARLQAADMQARVQELQQARAEVERWKGHHRTAGQESDVWERLASMRKVRMDGLQAERDAARAEAKQWEADYLAAAETVGKLEARCQALAAQAPVEQR